MQAAPVVQLTIRRFGAWNGFLILISTSVLCACGFWLVLRPADLSGWERWLVGGSLLAALLSFCASIRRHPVGLRWDRQGWYLMEMSRDSDEIGPVQVQVMIDLGGWMLLKFTSDAPREGRCARWLPVQRHGLEARWHALRCAVYSPRAERASSMGRRPNPH